LSRLSNRCFPHLSLVSRVGSIILGLFLCLVKVASAQVPVLTIACIPATGPTQVSVPYSATCTAAAGTAPYNWAIVAGSLPPGIALSSTIGTSVTVSGTPTTTGAYSYAVQVTDSTAPPQTTQ